MADYSKTLFSYQGKAPTYLPERLRLPDGFTRYSYSTTLEEINSLGYFGPIELPEHGPDEHVVWCSETLSYKVKRGVCPDTIICPPDNNEARALLMSRILNSEDSFDPNNVHTEEYQKEYGLYKGKLLDLYFKHNLNELSVSDIPPLPMIHNGLIAEETKFKQMVASGVIDQYRLEYETYGVIPNIDPCLVDWLPLPGEDWVRGSGLLIDPVSKYPVVFGRHCFS
jgi:hypothetical protein